MISTLLNSDISSCFSKEEADAILELRRRLRDFDTKESSLAKSYLYEDSTMWRYILAQSREKYPMDASEVMFRTSIRWREDIQLHNLLAEWRGENGKPTSARARLGELCFYGGHMVNKSKSGGPVLVEKIGHADLSGLSDDEYAFNCVTKSYIVYLEECWNMVRKQGEKVRGIIIIDVSKCGLGMLGYIPVIKQLSSTGVLRYPEICEKVYIVNSGWFMHALWEGIKSFLPSRTQGKFHILSSGDHNELFATIEGGADALPDFVGGNLGKDEHKVCAAESVDRAYGILVDEITSRRQEYPDESDFLDAALSHATTLASSSRLHQARVIQINEYILSKRHSI